jgi:hypothetical protein
MCDKASAVEVNDMPGNRFTYLLGPRPGPGAQTDGARSHIAAQAAHTKARAVKNACAPKQTAGCFYMSLPINKHSWRRLHLPNNWPPPLEEPLLSHYPCIG